MWGWRNGRRVLRCTYLCRTARSCTSSVGAGGKKMSRRRIQDVRSDRSRALGCWRSGSGLPIETLSVRSVDYVTPYNLKQPSSYIPSFIQPSTSLPRSSLNLAQTIYLLDRTLDTLSRSRPASRKAPAQRHLSRRQRQQTQLRPIRIITALLRRN